MSSGWEPDTRFWFLRLESRIHLRRQGTRGAEAASRSVEEPLGTALAPSGSVAPPRAHAVPSQPHCPAPARDGGRRPASRQGVGRGEEHSAATWAAAAARAWRLSTAAWRGECGLAERVREGRLRSGRRAKGGKPGARLACW